MSPQTYEAAPLPTGAIIAWAAPTLPAGYLWCDGQSYTRTTYPALAALLNPQAGASANVTISSVATGTDIITTSAAHGLTEGDQIYFTGSLPSPLVTTTLYYANFQSTTTLRVGVNRSVTTGNASSIQDLTTTTTGAAIFISPWGWVTANTNFNVPDLRGRTIVAPDVMWLSTSDAGRLGTSSAVGYSGGEETHVLTDSEMPVHNHGTGQTIFGGGFVAFGGGAQGVLSTTTDAGGDGAHNNMQPFIYVPYIIKY